MTPPRALTMLWLVVTIGGLVWLRHELERSQQRPIATDTPSSPAVPEIEKPLTWNDSVVDYGAIIERPLFNPSRRAELDTEDPRPAAVQHAIASAGNLNDIRVAAVYGKNTVDTAMLEIRGQQILTVRAGDLVEGWEVESIGEDGVVLVNHGQRQRLALYDFRSPPHRPAPQIVTGAPEKNHRKPTK